MEFISELAQTGILGLLLAISVYGNISQNNQIRESECKRIEDIKEIMEKDFRFKMELKTLMNNILDTLRENNV